MINEDLISENALIEAVEIRNHELNEKILEKRKDSSFIIEITERGNALYSAVCKTDLFSIKKLLSIPEIDLGIVVYVDPYRTPLNSWDSSGESSGEFITCLICEKYSIDFNNNNWFAADVTKNYYHVENKATFLIEILNKNPKLSKKINLQIKYLNKTSESTSLSLKLDDILNPENDWLFDDTLKSQITVFSVFKRINSFEKIEIPPLLPQKLTDDVFGHRFIIPIYLFDQNKFKNLIYCDLCFRNKPQNYRS